MYENLLYTLMLIGALQGIGFAVITLYSKKFKSKSNLFLAFLILCFSLNNLQYYFWETDILTAEVFFGIVYIPFASLSMVMYYFYVQFFLYPKSRISFAQKLLFIPFLFFLLFTVVYKIGNAMNLLSESHYQFFGNFIYVHEGICILYSLILLILSYRTILQFEKSQTKGNTGIPKQNLNWLKTVSLISFILCFIWVFALLDELKNGSDNVSFYYILWIGMSITIYILGHLGLYRFGIMQEQKKIQSYSRNSPAVIIERISSKNENIEAFENFIKKEKNYLDHNLSLDVVATKLNLNSSYLSRIINHELGISFSDYVNELRIEEAKTFLENAEFENYTLVAIGLEAGFNSKTAFNTAFKKFTRKTPSEYKKEKRANLS